MQPSGESLNARSQACFMQPYVSVAFLAKVIAYVGGCMLLAEAGWFCIFKFLHPSDNSIAWPIIRLLRIAAGNARFIFPVPIAAAIVYFNSVDRYPQRTILGTLLVSILVYVALWLTGLLTTAIVAIGLAWH